MATFMRSAASLIALAVLLTSCSSSTPEGFVKSAKEYLRKNELPAAIIELKNALQKQPDFAEARFLLGTALLESGDVVAAEKELRKAYELNYPPDHVVPPLARATAQLGEYKKVIDEFARADVATPAAKAELQTAIGQAQLGLNNVAAAEAAFAAALDSSPDYAPAHLGRAAIAASRQQWKQALATVDKAVAIAPKRVEGWTSKAAVLAAQGENAAAVDAYRKAVEVQPDSVHSRWGVVSLLLRQNKLDDAAKELDAMKKVAPNHPQTLYLQALLAYRRQNFPAAREAIQGLLKIAPEHLSANLLGSAIEYELKGYAQAETRALMVLQRIPNQRVAMKVLIWTYIRTGQPAKALNVLKPMLGKMDKDADMLAVAGEVFMVNGRVDEAADYFAKAAALDRGDVRKRTALALTSLARGDATAGFAELEQAAASDAGVRADLALISARIQRREYDDALVAIAALEKKQPNNPLAHNLRGIVLLAKNELSAARHSFERALEKDSSYFPATANLGRLDVAEKKLDAARRRFEKVIAANPKHMEALLALAEVRAASGAKPGEVAALLAKAISADPAAPAPRRALIAYHLSTNDSKRAMIAAREAVAAIPDRPELLDTIGRAYQAAGDTEQALATYSRLAALQPGVPEPLVRLSEVQIAAQNKVAALNTLQRALALRPEDVGIQRRIIALHIDAGRPQEALRVARAVQKQKPSSAIGYALEGDVYTSSKKWNEAISSYRRGLKLTGSSNAAARLHGVLMLSGDRAGAVRFASEWLDRNPKDYPFRLHVAQSALASKDYNVAAQHYRKLLDAHPDNPLFLNNLAWTTAQLNDPKAIELAERAYKLAPQQPPIMDTLGMLLVERGDTKRGVELLRQAATLMPQDLGIKFNLAKALVKAGDKEAARKELDELLKLGEKFAGHAEVAKLRQEL